MAGFLTPDRMSTATRSRLAPGRFATLGCGSSLPRSSPRLPVRMLAWLPLLLAALAGPVHAAGDPHKGADVFAEECGDCHSAVPGKDKKGPTLTGVNGRTAGSVASFAKGYSDAMKASGIVWSPERLDAYLAAPKKVVPGGRMKYDGLPDPAARANVIAYLLQLK